jgi:hypothetical protein
VTFPLAGGGPLVTLQTSEGGSGAVHIDFAAPTISDGTRFDVMFRLVDSPDGPNQRAANRVLHRDRKVRRRTQF